MKRLRHLAASLALAPALVGCELVAKFDRDRITEELPDVGVLFTGDGAVLGGDSDSAVRDAGLFDGATSAPPDELADAGTPDAEAEDARVDGMDAGAEDAGADTGLDAGLDAAAGDAQVDAGVVSDDAGVTDGAAPALDAAG